MIDADLVTRKMNLIAADFKALDSYRSLGLEAYLAEPVNEVIVERYLERIIGRMIDINYHIVTEMGQPPPKDYFDSFLQMGKLGALPVVFSRAIAQTSGLRNRIVHQYNELDEGKVYEALQQALEDIPRYMEHVQQFIQT